MSRRIVPMTIVTSIYAVVSVFKWTMWEKILELLRGHPYSVVNVYYAVSQQEKEGVLQGLHGEKVEVFPIRD